jgi:hypothetical protein
MAKNSSVDISSSSLLTSSLSYQIRIARIHTVSDNDSTINCNSKPYVVYEIHVTTSNGDNNSQSNSIETVIYRRYSTIKKFSEAILPLCNGFENSLVPAKKFLGNMDPGFVRQRTQELQVCVIFFVSFSFDKI